MAQSGQFPEAVSEQQLVSLLEKISENKKETTVKVSKCHFSLRSRSLERKWMMMTIFNLNIEF
jgi:hypothetical protein